MGSRQGVFGVGRRVRKSCDNDDNNNIMIMTTIQIAIVITDGDQSCIPSDARLASPCARRLGGGRVSRRQERNTVHPDRNCIQGWPNFEAREVKHA